LSFSIRRIILTQLPKAYLHQRLVMHIRRPVLIALMFQMALSAVANSGMKSRRLPL